MQMTVKYLMIVAFTFGLAACGGSSNKTPGVTVPPAPPPPPPPAMTVVDVAVANGSFTTLVAALQATGLDAVLDDPDGTFTVFAPTDAAFATLGEETINALLADPETLSNILLYHVISGAEVNSTAAIASAGTTVEVANGQSVGLSLNGSSLLVNVSVVTLADVAASNGVIHVIDAVLMPPAEKGEPTLNIVETAVANGNFTTLVAALQAAQLDGVLADEDATFTVFAPTDSAFAALGEANIEALLADPDALTAVLLQHVVADAELSSIDAYAANGTSLATLGGDVPVTIQGRSLRVGGAEVIMADVYTTNGVIHVIDTVIVGDLDLPAPPMSIIDVAVANGNFTLLAAALEATGLDVVLADLDETYTVFAPNDDAFLELGEDTIAALLADTDTLKDILLYHVIPDAAILADTAITVAAGNNPKVTTALGKQVGLSLGDGDLFVNLSKVIANNVMASNGVIHVLDKVLLPPADVGTPTRNIVETAIDAGIFTTLVDAVVIAGLDATLSDPDETFTVFAPTDAAFAAIDPAVLNALLADPAALGMILGQHVIAGAAVDSITAFTLNGTAVETAAGNNVTIAIVDGELEIQGSKVIMFDIYTTNGIIHVIDAVIVEAQE